MENIVKKHYLFFVLLSFIASTGIIGKATCTTAIVLYGAPCSGASTTAEGLYEYFDKNAADEQWKLLILKDICDSSPKKYNFHEEGLDSFEIDLMLTNANDLLDQGNNIIIATHRYHDWVKEHLRATRTIIINMHADLPILLSRHYIRSHQLNRPAEREEKMRRHLIERFEKLENCNYNYRLETIEQSPEQLVSHLLGIIAHAKQLTRSPEKIPAKRC